MWDSEEGVWDVRDILGLLSGSHVGFSHILLYIRLYVRVRIFPIYVLIAAC